MQHTLYEWGRVLGARRRLDGLSHGDVANLVGLGEHLTAADVEAAERGHGSYSMLGEISEALGVGVRVVPCSADELRDEWAAGVREREAARRELARFDRHEAGAEG